MFGFVLCLQLFVMRVLFCGDGDSDVEW
jgi:hypothetical protein